MKKLLLFAICAFVYTAVSAQFSASLTGTPVVTTGWSIGGNAAVNGASIKLTNPINTQSGYIYYSTPTNLSACGSFTVDFDFQIIPTGCTADGIAFYYISNPPAGFVGGGGLGLPGTVGNYPNGLVLVLDTYDNGGMDPVPISDLFYDPGTFPYNQQPQGNIGNYISGQNFIDDGNWHHCRITYNAGLLDVYFNNSATASISGTQTLSLTGYFGFSASTGACNSTQSVENVFITGSSVSTAPVVTSQISYCQNSTAVPLTAGGTNLTWYTTIGGTPLPGAPTPNTSTPGTTTYYVTQNPAGTCVSPPDSIQVIVNPIPAPPVIAGPENYCTGNAFVPFTVTGQDVLWYPSASGGTPSPVAPVVNTANPGAYTFYATQTVNGCESAIDSITVTVHTAATAGYTYAIKYGCAQDTVVFTDTSHNAASWYWNFGDGATSTSENPVHIYTTRGSYNVKLIVTSPDGCLDSVTQTVNTAHPLVAAYTVDKDSVCTGQPITFTNTSIGNGLTSAWSFGDGGSAFTSGPSHTYNQAGVYTPTLTVTDFVPCQATATQQVYVGSVNFTIGFHDTTICLSDSMLIQTQLTALPQDAPGLFSSYNYVWTPSVGLGSTSIAEPYFYDFGTYTYYVTVTSVPLGCTASDSATINSFQHIQLTNVTVSQTIPYGDSIQLNADGGLYYFWTPENGTLNNPNINDPIATPLNPTDYVVHVLNEYGCADSAIVHIDIDYGMTEFIPSAFSPNGDGRNDVFRILNMKYQKLLEFNVYNRWGQLIFHTTNVSDGWDGTYKGTPQDVGVYNYNIIVARPDGTERNYTGTVTLLR